MKDLDKLYAIAWVNRHSSDERDRQLELTVAPCRLGYQRPPRPPPPYTLDD